MIRSIIKIDEEKCDGCGDCVPECHEGALQVIEGKVRLISDLFCDGLGACIGHCPQDAISVEQREAEPYNEKKVLDIMLKKPYSVLTAHMKHLRDHNADEFLNEAIEYLKELGIKNPLDDEASEVKPKINVQVHDGHQESACGCPGSQMMSFEQKVEEVEAESNQRSASELAQWPVQLHLVGPNAPYFKNSELVIMSTCGPIASANVHQDYFRGRSVVVACPKLDRTEPYVEKLAGIFQMANTTKVTVVVMVVPCCGGLINMTTEARKLSGREDLEIEVHTMALDGEIKRTQFV